ncbi:MAG: hypothetical protein HZC36_13195 [Armatimonadetes bacterium]|nr:hypothetical protein [Armatimonadota bacterium]
MSLAQFALCSLFALYVVAMNALVGTLVIAGVCGLKRRSSPLHAAILCTLAPAMPILAAATVFLGIGQLFGLDAVYGWLFIGESAQQAWLVPAAIAGIVAIGLSVLMASGAKKGAISWGYSWVLAILAVGMSAVATTNALTLPDVLAYDQLQAQGFGGHSVNLAGNLAFARFFHFLVSGPAIGGLWLAFISRKVTNDAGLKTTALGARWFIIATAINFIVGPWYLFAIPKPIRLEFLGQGQLETGALWFGVLFALAAMHFCRKKVVLASVLTFGSLLLMVVSRQRLRDIKLSEAFASPIPHEAASSLWAQAGLACVVGLVFLGWALRPRTIALAEESLDNQ